MLRDSLPRVSEREGSKYRYLPIRTSNFRERRISKIPVEIIMMMMMVMAMMLVSFIALGASLHRPAVIARALRIRPSPTAVAAAVAGTGIDPFALSDELVLESGDTPDESNDKAAKTKFLQSSKSNGKESATSAPSGFNSEGINRAAIARMQKSQSQDLAAAAIARGKRGSADERSGEFSISQLSLTEISQCTQVR